MKVRLVGHRWWLVGAMALGWSFAAGSVGVHTSAAEDAAPKNTCYKITGNASYRGFGYKHIVTVTNQCAYVVTCEVWTDVDPSPKHKLSVPKNESKSVVTRVGSPSSAFAAQGTCSAPDKKAD